VIIYISAIAHDCHILGIDNLGKEECAMLFEKVELVESPSIIAVIVGIVAIGVVSVVC